MGTNEVPIYNGYHRELLKQAYSPPERSFTTPWLFTNRGLFRINLTIVGPVTKEPKGDFSLIGSEAKAVLEAISHEIVLLKEELR